VAFVPVIFETNNFGPSAVLVSSLVSELQEPPSLGFELRTLFEFDPAMFSSWPQGISMPSLLQIGVSVFELELNLHTNIPTVSIRFHVDEDSVDAKWQL
jgi:hypothetical protein